MLSRVSRFFGLATRYVYALFTADAKSPCYNTGIVQIMHSLLSLNKRKEKLGVYFNKKYRTLLRTGLKSNATFSKNSVTDDDGIGRQDEIEEKT